MTPNVDPVQMDKVRNTPGVAMCNGKIIRRWDRSGDSHWILGSKKKIDGYMYKLLDIQVTDNLIYHMCEPVEN